MHSQPELHLPRQRGGVDAGDATESSRRGGGQRRIAHSCVVQQVGDLEAEVGSKRLAESNRLSNAKIQIPTRQTTQRETAAVCVEAQDTLAELRDHSSGVGEHVDTGRIVRAYRPRG